MEFATIIERAFATVFGYRTTVMVEPRVIWNTLAAVESGASAQG